MAIVERVRSRRSWPAVLFLSVLAGCQQAPPGPVLPPWVDLFNGQDLSGWVNVNCAPSTWTVRDGMVICSGKPTGVLRTERMYQDFDLELEWRHMQPQGNAGLFLWSDALTARGQPFTRSIEVQILDGRNTANYTSHGDVFAIHGATMTPDRPHPAGSMRCLPSERRSLDSPQWNHYLVRCRNGVVKLEVNGKEVSGGHSIRPRRGYLCLESEGSEVHFRNVRIIEHPAVEPMLPADMIAVADQGFRSIYTGIDLDGWTPAAGNLKGAGWMAADWLLRQHKANHFLLSKKHYGDFELGLDFRWLEAVSGAPSSHPNLADASVEPDARCHVAPPVVPDELWHRLEIRVVGGRMEMSLDHSAVQMEELNGRPARGRLKLGSPYGRVEYANLYLKELPATETSGAEIPTSN